MTKVLFVVSSLRICGPVVVLHGIAQHLRETGFEASILTLSPEPKSSMRGDFEALGFDISCLGLKKRNPFIPLRKIRMHIEENGVDLLHSHGPRPDLIASKLRNFLPVVTTIHGNPLEDYPLRFGKVAGGLAARWHLKSLKAIRNRVSISKSDEASLARRAGLSTTVINNGVDLNALSSASSAEKSALRHQLGISSDAPVVVVAGTFSPRKDQATAIEAFKRLPAGSASLVLVGHSGPCLQQCREAAKGVGNLHVLPDVESPIPFMRLADIYLSTSMSEGFGLNVVEALACGLPPILSDIPPHRELLEPGPGLAKYFTPGDADELATQLLRVLESLPSDPTRSVEISQSYSSKLMSQRYQQLYRSLDKAIG